MGKLRGSASTGGFGLSTQSLVPQPRSSLRGQLRSQPQRAQLVLLDETTRTQGYMHRMVLEGKAVNASTSQECQGVRAVRINAATLWGSGLCQSNYVQRATDGSLGVHVAQGLKGLPVQRSIHLAECSFLTQHLRVAMWLMLSALMKAMNGKLR